MVSTRTASFLFSVAVLGTLAPPALAQVGNDSTAVPVIQNPPATQAASRWTVGAATRVEIGGATDDPRYQLFEVVAAARMADGRIVVANHGSREVRFYDEEGAYIAAVGGEGGGPGEFRDISGLQVSAEDSIYVHDRRLQRVSVFDPGGELVRTARIQLHDASARHLARFRDGGWYAQDGIGLQPGSPGSIRRGTVRFTRFDPMLQPQSLITTLPGVLTVTFRVRGDVGYRVAPFSPTPLHGVFGNCLYVSSADDFEVRIFSSSGRLIRVVRNAGERQPISDESVAAWQEVQLGQFPAEAQPLLREIFEQVPMPESLPAYSDLVVDALGYIWLEQYAPPDDPGRQWIVLAPDGTLHGRVKMPVVLDVYDIGPDYVLGRWRNDLGEEFVRLYPLYRDNAPVGRPPVECGAARVTSR